MAMEPGPVTDRPSAALFDRWVAAAAVRAAEAERDATVAARLGTGAASTPQLVPLNSRRVASTGAMLQLIHLHSSDQEQMTQVHRLLAFSRDAVWYYLSSAVFPATMK